MGTGWPDIGSGRGAGARDFLVVRGVVGRVSGAVTFVLSFGLFSSRRSPKGAVLPADPRWGNGSTGTRSELIGVAPDIT